VPGSESTGGFRFLDFATLLPTKSLLKRVGASGILFGPSPCGSSCRSVMAGPPDHAGCGTTAK
jgi:hypothetical protein